MVIHLISIPNTRPIGWNATVWLSVGYQMNAEKPSLPSLVVSSKTVQLIVSLLEINIQLPNKFKMHNKKKFLYLF